MDDGPRHEKPAELGDRLSFASILRTSSPGIADGNALEMDWAGLLPPEEYPVVFGEPPFEGARFQGKAQLTLLTLSPAAQLSHRFSGTG